MDRTELKNTFVGLLYKTDRLNIGALVNFLEKTGFFDAPCSTGYHLCYEGGLLEHSLNVYDFAYSLCVAWNIPEDVISEDSLIIACLLHDIGKAGEIDKMYYAPNVLKSGERSKSKPYVVDSSLSFMSHEARGLKNICKFIDLTEDEEFAIYHHNGMYGDAKYSLNGKERPLQLVLHFADLYCSRVTEMRAEEND
ncbi:MAG: HD domain-containing protein [Ruminococcaceae bacterium]|nr:HD domain-containing protein [Oscillospiraceae bacterium]